MSLEEHFDYRLLDPATKLERIATETEWTGRRRAVRPEHFVLLKLRQVSGRKQSFRYRNKHLSVRRPATLNCGRLLSQISASLPAVYT